MAEGFALSIEDDAEVGGLMVVVEFGQHFDDAMQGTGRVAVAGGERRQAVEGAEEVGRAVHKDDEVIRVGLVHGGSVCGGRGFAAECVEAFTLKNLLAKAENPPPLQGEARSGGGLGRG